MDRPAEEGESRTLTGEAVIDYFTWEVVGLNAESGRFLCRARGETRRPVPGGSA